MKAFFDEMIAAFAAVGDTVFGTDDNIKDFFKAVLAYVLVLFGGLFAATVIVCWSALLVRLLG